MPFVLKGIPPAPVRVSRNDKQILTKAKEHNTYTSKHQPWEFAVLFECGCERGKAMNFKSVIEIAY
jgi:hypothetical protein